MKVSRAAVGMALLVHYHNEAKIIAVELWDGGLVRTRAEAVNQAFDAVEEASGLDLQQHRAAELYGVARYEEQSGG